MSDDVASGEWRRDEQGRQRGRAGEKVEVDVLLESGRLVDNGRRWGPVVIQCWRECGDSRRDEERRCLAAMREEG